MGSNFTGPTINSSFFILLKKGSCACITSGGCRGIALWEQHVTYTTNCEGNNQGVQKSHHDHKGFS